MNKKKYTHIVQFKSLSPFPMNSPETFGWNRSFIKVAEMFPDSVKLTHPIFKNKFDLFNGWFPNPLNYRVVVRVFCFSKVKVLAMVQMHALPISQSSLHDYFLARRSPKGDIHVSGLWHFGAKKKHFRI